MVQFRQCSIQPLQACNNCITSLAALHSLCGRSSVLPCCAKRGCGVLAVYMMKESS